MSEIPPASRQAIDQLVISMAGRAADAETMRRTITAVYNLGVVDGALQAVRAQTEKVESAHAPRH